MRKPGERFRRLSTVGGFLTFRKKKSVSENAAVALPVLARKFFDADREAASPGASPKSLHRFRLMTKRFRYTLELFVRRDPPFQN